MKSFIANTLVKWFKAFPYFGRFRFWCLYWAYRITGWHIRHKEWDFVLGYLPSLGKWQSVSVLDVGCSRNLLCHELVARGYKLTGVDLEEPNFKYPAKFSRLDIRGYVGEIYQYRYDFVTCISVLEHIEESIDGLGDHSVKFNSGQLKAITNMINVLKIGGRLLLTIPTNEFAQGHPWRGFSMTDLINLLPKNAMIQELTERVGQICCAIERVS